MHFFCIGVDYKKTPLAVRERLYRQRQEISSLSAGNSFTPQTALLLTCNRIELYGQSMHEQETRVFLLKFARAFPLFTGFSYTRAGNKQVQSHALRLAAGLESQLPGEYQVAQQLKMWSSARDFPDGLHRLWQEVLAEAEDIRMSAGLPGAGYTLASVVFDEVRALSGGGEPIQMVVAGTGKVAECFAMEDTRGIRVDFAAHKNFAKAHALAARSGGKAYALAQARESLATADVLVAASRSPHFLFAHDFFAGIVSLRQTPLYIYDLAFPRDIDPRVADIGHVRLKDLDGIVDSCRGYSRKICSQLKSAEYLIGETLVRQKESEYAAHV